MTRNELGTILTGVELTDAKVKAILDANSADITKALNKQKDDLTAAKDALTKANETIAALEKNKGDTEALQKQIDAYREADQRREQEAQAAAARAEVEGRFDRAAGDRKFIHEMVRKGVMEEFQKAIADKSNMGKSDAEIFDALTRDQAYFASQNPGGGSGMAGFSQNTGDPDSDKLSDAEYYAGIFKDRK